MVPVKTKFSLAVLALLLVGLAAFIIKNRCPPGDESCEAREPVGFPHERHMASYDCLECHHVYDALKNNVLAPMELYDGNPEIRCRHCHTPEATIVAITAFHRQCISCHNQEAAAGRVSGPNMCSDCHGPEEAIPAEYEMIIGD